MFSKYFLSFFFQRGVSNTDQYFLLADLANTLLNSESITFIPSGDFFSFGGKSLMAGLPSFSTRNSSPLYMARLMSSKNLFRASVAESIVIVYKVYTGQTGLSSLLLLLVPQRHFDGEVLAVPPDSERDTVPHLIFPDCLC